MCLINQVHMSFCLIAYCFLNPSGPLLILKSCSFFFVCCVPPHSPVSAFCSPLPSLVLFFFFLVFCLIISKRICSCTGPLRGGPSRLCIIVSGWEMIYEGDVYVVLPSVPPAFDGVPYASFPSRSFWLVSSVGPNLRRTIAL